MTLTYEQLTELLEEMSTQPESFHIGRNPADCGPDCCLDTEPADHDESPADDGVPPAEAIDQIISGTLNVYLETGTFPTEEQAHVLTQLRALQTSYYQGLYE